MSELSAGFFTMEEINQILEITKGTALIQKAAELGILYMPTSTTVVVWHDNPNEGWYEDDLLESAANLMKQPEAVEMLEEAIREKEKEKNDEGKD